MTRQTEEEVGRQHQGMDRPGDRQVSVGSGEQGKMEKTGCKIICGVPTTLAVKELVLLLLMMIRMDRWLGVWIGGQLDGFGIYLFIHIILCSFIYGMYPHEVCPSVSSTDVGSEVGVGRRMAVWIGGWLFGWEVKCIHVTCVAVLPTFGVKFQTSEDQKVLLPTDKQFHSTVSAR